MKYYILKIMQSTIFGDLIFGNIFLIQGIGSYNVYNNGEQLEFYFQFVNYHLLLIQNNKKELIIHVIFILFSQLSLFINPQQRQPSDNGLIFLFRAGESHFALNKPQGTGFVFFISLCEFTLIVILKQRQGLYNLFLFVSRAVELQNILKQRKQVEFAISIAITAVILLITIIPFGFAANTSNATVTATISIQRLIILHTIESVIILKQYKETDNEFVSIFHAIGCDASDIQCIASRISIFRAQNSSIHYTSHYGP